MRKIAAPITFLVAAWIAATPVLATPAAAGAAAWQPISVAIDCRSSARTDICGALLLGLIDDEPLLTQGRLGSADVIVHVNVVEAGADDLVDLRFTSGMPGVDASTELVVGVPAFGTFDEQLAPLRYALRRGVIPFVAARYPDAVRVELVAPQGARVVEGSPWDFVLSASGSHSGELGDGGSFTNVQLAASVRRTTPHEVGGLWLELGYARWEPGDAEGEPMETSEAMLGHAAARWERHLVGSLWLGASAQTRLERSEDYASESTRLHALAVLRLLPIDDRRGNVFDLVYGIGGERARTWVDGELVWDDAAPTHSLGAIAAVRFDRLTLSGQAGAFARLEGEGAAGSSRWFRAEESILWRATRTLDVGFSISQAKGDLGTVVPTEEWAFSASFDLRLHWDRTNGARRVLFSPLP